MVLGDHDVLKKERQDRHVNVCGIYVHRLFVASDFVSCDSCSTTAAAKSELKNDIALLKLCKTIDYTPSIQPIKLIPKNFRIPKSSPVTAAGWGRREENGTISRHLEKVTVETIELATCKRAYNWISDDQICAGSKRHGGGDTCKGDSGGPLWYKSNGTTYQVGIVSGGKGCGRFGYPGYYTRIAHYRDIALQYFPISWSYVVIFMSCAILKSCAVLKSRSAILKFKFAQDGCMILKWRDIFNILYIAYISIFYLLYIYKAFKNVYLTFS